MQLLASFVKRAHIFNSASERAAFNRDALMGQIMMGKTDGCRDIKIDELIEKFGDDKTVHAFLMKMATTTAQEKDYCAGRSLLVRIARKASEDKAKGLSSRSGLDGLQYACANQWLEFANNEFSKAGKSNEDLVQAALGLMQSQSWHMRVLGGNILMQTVVPRPGPATEVDNGSRNDFSVRSLNCG